MFSTELRNKFWKGPGGDFFYRNRGGILNRLFDRSMDLFLGMETRRQVDPENHGFDPSEANSYVPSEWWAVSFVLARIPIGTDDVFVDLGCGKGRVIKIAARYPFRRLVGVELMPAVAEGARRNLGRSKRVEILTGDAREVPLPEDTTLVFLFNPFSLDVLLQVVNRLRDFSRSTGRALRLLYHSPVHHEILMARQLVRDVSEIYLPVNCLEEFRIYEIQGGSR